MNILNLFDLQIPVSIEKEINNSIILLDSKIEGLISDYSYIEKFENQISSNLDKNTVIDRMKNFEDLSMLEYRSNTIKIFIDSLKLCNEQSDKINLISQLLELVKKEIGNDLDKIFLNETYNIIKSSQIEDFLFRIKFPIFEGANPDILLKDIMNNKIKECEFLRSYFGILEKLELPDKHNTKEYFSEFIFKKIEINILNPFYSLTNDDQFYQFSQHLDMLVRYLIKAIDNTYSLISYFTKENKLIIIIISNLIDLINESVNKHKVYHEMTKNKINLLKCVKTISLFYKILSKTYKYDLYNQNLIDFIPNDVKEISDNIKYNKEFIDHYIKVNIKTKIDSSVESNIMNDEVSDFIKLLIKDNISILLISNNKNIVSFLFENNFIYCLESLHNLFRNLYNDEVQIFSKFKNIPRKKSLFCIDLLVSYYLYVIKIYDKFISISDNSNKISKIINDINKTINDYTHMLTKTFRTLAIDDFTSLFTINKLNSLSEENIEHAYDNLHKNIKNLYDDIDSLKLSIECENFILSAIIVYFTDKISEELEKSLKKNPKNSNFNILIDKIKLIIKMLSSRYTLSQNTMNIINPKMKLLNSLLNTLNMNKI